MGKVSLNFNHMDLASSFNNFQSYSYEVFFELLETSEESRATWSIYEQPGDKWFNNGWSWISLPY